MKRINALLLLLLVAGTVRPVLSKTFIQANHPYIQYFGRWDKTDSTAARHSWPGTYIAVKFEGTSIGVRMFDNFCYYNIFIDGNPYQMLHCDTYGSKDYSLATGLKDTVHTLIFAKRNETHWTQFTFYGFLLDDGKGLAEPDPLPERRIEFIGDSYTSASGNLATTEGTPDNVHLDTDTWEGFGAIVARHYDADYHLTSISGYGMVLDYLGNYDNTLPKRFSRILIPTNNPKWDFSQWQPNLVVIGLGLNDVSGFGLWDANDGIDEEETELYISTYRQFLATMRDYYPGVKFLAVAPHVDWIRTTVAEMVNREQEAGNYDVFYAQYSYYDGHYVNNGHPDVTAHYGIADELIAAIDSIDAWQPYEDILPPVFTQTPGTDFVMTDTVYTIRMETDCYATVRYSFSDQEYDNMEYEFTTTGNRKHSVRVACEQNQEYTFFIRAKDQAGNAMTSSYVLSFSVDTAKAPIRWFQASYPADTTEWKNAPSPLGVNWLDLVTETAYANTVYFRRWFTIDDPTAISGLNISVYYDDGAVVYLNNAEMCRLNISGDIDSMVYSVPALGEKVGMTDYQLTGDQLQRLKSDNLLAVEIHQCTNNAGNIYFNSQVTGTTTAGSTTFIPFGSSWDYFDLGFMPQDILRDSTAIICNENPVKLISYILMQNYPNPFNPVTCIAYSIPENCGVTLAVFDLAGRLIETLVQQEQPAGTYRVDWNASRYSSGIYFYRIQTGNHSSMKKCILIK